jgi:hypothetical protein
LGRIIFLRRFIPNLDEILKHITNKMRKGNQIRWKIDEKKSFDEVKVYLTKALVLVSLFFSREFIIFSFASEHTIAGVLMQKNYQNQEQPITFFSRSLRDSTLKFNIMENQAYALVKALKESRMNILHSHVIAYVPNSVVKDILTQPDPDGKRGKRIASMLEYDLEIKPTKLIKGQGIAQMMNQTLIYWE